MERKVNINKDTFRTDLPIIIKVEEPHIRFGGLQDQISKLLDLHARLEGQIEFGALITMLGKSSK